MSHKPIVASKSSACSSASRVPATATRPDDDAVADGEGVTEGDDVGEAPMDNVDEGEPEPLAEPLLLAETEGVGIGVIGAEGERMKPGAPFAKLAAT